MFDTVQVVFVRNSRSVALIGGLRFLLCQKLKQKEIYNGTARYLTQ